MSAEGLDLVVVGGGIHGAGVLQAAAAAGHRALLLEQRELAFGTSSRSSKLIHGGLRYLETFQLALVRESLSERRVLLAVAPDLVRLVPFFLPVYRATSRRPGKIRAGLALYAALAGLWKRDARFQSLPRREWDRLDGLATDGLQAVFRYFDAQTDDALLVRAVARSAVELGARVACPAPLLSARRAGEGWTVRYRDGDSEREVRCAALVNAAGPWIDLVQQRIDPAPPRPPVELVQGAHVELEGEIREGIYYTEAPRDRRAVFTMPWKGRTLVGTTETPYAGDPALVRPLEEELDYLVETFARHFPARAVRVLRSWAGLRVLPAGKGPAFWRRRGVLYAVDDRARPRLVAIYGGKLTSYRATAHKALSLLRRTLPRAKRVADTRTLRLAAPP